MTARGLQALSPVALIVMAAFALFACADEPASQERPPVGPGGKRQSVQPALKPRAQGAALDALAGRPGAVVAVDLRQRRAVVVAGAGGVMPGRTRIMPGSTLKVVLAGAALDAGIITPDTRLDGDGTTLPSVQNVGGERLGPITVSRALALSSNTAFVDLSLRLGAARLERVLRRGGWDAPPALDLGGAPSGSSVADVAPFVRRDGHYRDPDRRQRTTVAQLALLAAAVAGDGHVPAGGETEAPRRLWGPDTSAVLRDAMRSVVLSGTATTLRDAPRPAAAKTGTMLRLDRRVQASMIAFAPAESPRYALAVSVAAAAPVTGDTGAGPIALAVLRELLGETQGSGR